jgi:hypothetical protein
MSIPERLHVGYHRAAHHLGDSYRVQSGENEARLHAIA